MKRITMIASVLLFAVVQAFAQKEFKLAKSSGKLVISNISNLKVEGYEGKEIIFSATSSKKEKKEDPRAAGLSALSSAGFDNTGVGISVTEKENLIIVSPIEKDVKLSVKLPLGVALSIKTSGFLHRDSTVIVLNNLKSEIDASTQYENINLSNVTGPVSLKTLYGNIEGKLMPSFKGPISLVSVYGFIDVTVPDQAKADITINSQYENLYAAKDLKLVMDENPTRENIAFGHGFTSRVNGKNVQVVSLDGLSTTSTATSKAKGKTTTTTITTSETSASPSAETPPTPPTPERPATPKRATTIVGEGVFDFATVPSTYSYSFGGTNVNGKLNGGGEKIILKSTYGKIYLRK